MQKNCHSLNYQIYFGKAHEKEERNFSSLLHNFFPEQYRVQIIGYHSFHAEPEDRSIITSVCDYGMEVTASVGRGNVQAFQFHPEKSSRVGMRLLKNFVEL